MRSDSVENGPARIKRPATLKSGHIRNESTQAMINLSMSEDVDLDVASVLDYSQRETPKGFDERQTRRIFSPREMVKRGHIHNESTRAIISLSMSDDADLNDSPGLHNSEETSEGLDEARPRRIFSPRWLTMAPSWVHGVLLASFSGLVFAFVFFFAATVISGFSMQEKPSIHPSFSLIPSSAPSELNSYNPTYVPSDLNSSEPSLFPSSSPSIMPTSILSNLPSQKRSTIPTLLESEVPSLRPTSSPTLLSSKIPSTEPSEKPSRMQSFYPTVISSSFPSSDSSLFPSSFSMLPSILPTTNIISHPSTNIIGGILQSQSPSSHPTYPPYISSSTMFSRMPSIDARGDLSANSSVSGSTQKETGRPYTMFPSTILGSKTKAPSIYGIPPATNHIDQTSFYTKFPTSKPSKQHETSQTAMQTFRPTMSDEKIFPVT